MWRRAERALLVAITVLGAAGCDQGTKHWAREALAGGPREFFASRLQLTLASNRGAFLSLGDGLPPRLRTIIFSVFVLVALVAALTWVLRRGGRSRVETIAIALVVGGGFGNLLDRILRSGAVTDFIFLQLGPLHTGVFNVADICITAGVVAVLFTQLRTRRELVK
ncbi:MAG TPA: signal peptidase II [Thermoanaerobaculia bacterium]|nr:signal peptidase II [Thermoanaerobaculia bacterium]